MLPENIIKLIGKQFGEVVFDIEKEPVKRFADAVGETNPLYYDAEYARNSVYGGIIAPPGFISAPWYWDTAESNSGTPDTEISGLTDVILALTNAGYTQVIDSGIDYEFFLPVCVGDTITSTSTVKDIVERGIGDEKAVFLFTETTYTNRNN